MGEGEDQGPHHEEDICEEDEGLAAELVGEHAPDEGAHRCAQSEHAGHQLSEVS